jgi:hypothetical protein
MTSSTRGAAAVLPPRTASGGLDRGALALAMQAVYSFVPVRYQWSRQRTASEGIT